MTVIRTTGKKPHILGSISDCRNTCKTCFFSSGKPCKDRINTSQQEVDNLEVALKLGTCLADLPWLTTEVFMCQISHLFCWSSKTSSFPPSVSNEEFHDVFCTEETSWKAWCPMYRPLLQWVSLALRLTKRRKMLFRGCETCVGIGFLFFVCGCFFVLKLRVNRLSFESWFIDETEILNPSSWIAPSYPQLMNLFSYPTWALPHPRCNAMGFLSYCRHFFVFPSRQRYVGSFER